jgi:hypothetical protein
MKEVTMITTCEITCVNVLSDEQADFVTSHRDEITRNVGEILKSDCHADHEDILNNQIFIRDVQE